MKDQRFLEIKELVERFRAITSKDAFLAAMAEQGVTDRDIRKYGKEALKQEREFHSARRVSR